jgi:hypothetical protein
MQDQSAAWFKRYRPTHLTIVLRERLHEFSRKVEDRAKTDMRSHDGAIAKLPQKHESCSHNGGWQERPEQQFCR